MKLGWLLTNEVLLNARAVLGVNGDFRGFVRLHFLSVAAQTGLIDALEEPATGVELAARLGFTDDQLQSDLLGLGVAVGELRYHRGRYSLKGTRIRAMAVDHGQALRAMTVELADYHGSVYQELPKRLSGADAGAYLDQYDTIIALSSRLVEPFVARFVRRVVQVHSARTLLEIGCGSGIYLRHAAAASAELTGDGVDLSQSVVALAEANLERWGLSERFTVRHHDIREQTPELSGPYDLITLHNNIYYFSEEERRLLLGELRQRLSPQGVLALVSLFRGRTITSWDLDLTLRSTAGCSGLPDRFTLPEMLTECGYRRVRFFRLLPTEPLYGVVAQV